MITVTSAEIANAWRPLTPAETSRATYLAGAAWRMLARRWKDIEGRILANDPPEGDVKDAIIGMVVTAMGSPVVGAEQFAQVSGPFSLSVRFASGSKAGQLVITDDIADLFGGVPISARVGWLA